MAMIFRNTECPLCYDKLAYINPEVDDERTNWKCDNCDYIFHEDCADRIMPNINGLYQCPMCRELIDPCYYVSYFLGDDRDRRLSIYSPSETRLRAILRTRCIDTDIDTRYAYACPDIMRMYHFGRTIIGPTVADKRQHHH